MFAKDLNEPTPTATFLSRFSFSHLLWIFKSRLVPLFLTHETLTSSQMNFKRRHNMETDAT